MILVHFKDNTLQKVVVAEKKNQETLAWGLH